MTLTLELSAEVAARLREEARLLARPVEAVAADVLTALYLEDDEPVDEAFIAELRAADEEADRARRAGVDTSVALEDLIQRYDADEKSELGLVESARVRLASSPRKEHVGTVGE